MLRSYRTAVTAKENICRKHGSFSSDS